jgi:WD40 repeat protein
MPSKDGIVNQPPTIPDHELIRLIGTGSYGDVWLARNVVGAFRAVKIVYRNRFQDEKPFRREFSGVQRFEPVSRGHEGLVDVLQVGRNDEKGNFYCVMELADDAGERESKREQPEDGDNRIFTGANPELYVPHTLTQELQRRGRLPTAECVQLGLALSLALEYLHERGLVHRDIKPSNVIFVNGTPKLADIGLVAETGEGMSLVGTVGFMPPEGPGTPQADIFSLGKVLYELSTGKDREQWPRPLTELDQIEDREQWLELNEVITKACQLDPQKRYKSASEIRSDLALLLAGESIRGLRHRERRLKRLLAVAAIGMVIAAVWVGVQHMLNVEVRERARAAESVAKEQIRGNELREAKIARLGLRSVGWYSNYTARLERALQIRSDSELIDEASIGMAGLELKFVAGLAGVGASSVAFGRERQAVFGGTATNHAYVLATGRTNLQEVQIVGDGPVAFNANGKPVQFVWIKDGEFALRDLAAGEIYRRFGLNGQATTGYDCRPVLALSVDASIVAAAVQTSEGGRLVVWDCATGKELTARNELITALAITPENKFMALGHDDGSVTVCAVANMQEISKMQSGRAAIHSLAFGRDAAVTDVDSSRRGTWLLAAGDGAAMITVYRLYDGEVVARCKGSAFDIHALAFRSDGAVLASGGRAGVRFWDVATGDPLLRCNNGDRNFSFEYIRGLAFSADDKRFAIASEEVFNGSSVSVWDVQAERGVTTLHGLEPQAERVWWSEDGKQVAALAHNWKLAVWEVATGKLTHLMEVPLGESPDNSAVAFDADGRRLAFGAGRKVTLYDLSERKLVRSWEVPLGFCESIRFEERNKLLFLHAEVDAQRNGHRRWAFYDLFSENWKAPIWRQKDKDWITWSTTLIPGGKYFLVCGGTGDKQKPNSQIRAVSIETGEEMWNVSSTRYYQNCYYICDPLGNFLVYPLFNDADGARLIRIPGRELVAEFKQLPQSMSPSGKDCSVVADRGCLLYNANDFEHAARVGGDFHSAGETQFSPDGSRLAMPTTEGYVLVADLAKVKSYLHHFGRNP